MIHLFFHRLALGDVREQRYILPDVSLPIAHRADGLHLGEYLAVLAPVPDFAVPVAFLAEIAPQRIVEFFALTARTEEVRLAPHHFVAVVAGDAAEGVVDIDDGAVRFGDHDALVGMGEDAGGELQALFAGLQFEVDAINVERDSGDDAHDNQHRRQAAIEPDQIRLARVV